MHRQKDQLLQRLARAALLVETGAANGLQRRHPRQLVELHLMLQVEQQERAALRNAA